MVTEGSVVPGTGRGRVHVRSPGFRFGVDKLSPAADDPGRHGFLGLGSGMGLRGSMLRCGVCVWFQVKDLEGKGCPGEGLPWWETFAGDVRKG